MTDTVNVAGVVPDEGVTVTKLNGDEAVKLVALVPVSIIVWELGATPEMKLKFNEVGLALIVPALPADTVKVMRKGTWSLEVPVRVV